MNATPITERQAAYTATAKALARGQIEKPLLCERCREPGKTVYAHHPDYQRPLEIRWLCGSCHKQTHIEAGEVQHWRTGRAVVALTAEERAAQLRALWAKTKSIRVKHDYGEWRVLPRGNCGLKKREALRLARALAGEHNVPIIKVYNKDGDVERIIDVAKKNGNKKAAK